MNFEIKTGEDLFLIVVLCCLILGALALMVTTLHLYLTVKQAFPDSSKKEVDEPYQYSSLWHRIMGLRPTAMNDQLMLEHAPDGIQELDNPTPGWFMALFYGTIVCAIGYMLYYHVLGPGDVMNQEYTAEMAVAEKAHEEYLKKFANSVNESNVTILRDEKAIEAGKKIFDQNCTACHGAAGEGKVGPNLTDNYWLHGGTINAVFKTIAEGVPDKGMLSWKKQLNPIQIQQVSSYIFSLQGTKPAGAKEPQGEEVKTAPDVAKR
ncbi:cbb3-type cytochrome c oxidase N-terminal domain-containing protein [Siphonobacter curvatus]|uniref:Cytochrome C n=1 Tax=Siphonobacter curvatus TaxID=2094562 RepID=A0A2S7IT35_9BACT|nr:cbb3-type cytochrome c oxidase N-terminal domain-containing protein [Siphonobacter curvatus]PQA60842.1 cytochrome C [Siphonobacter curvatus]